MKIRPLEKRPKIHLINKWTEGWKKTPYYLKHIFCLSYNEVILTSKKCKKQMKLRVKTNSGGFFSTGQSFSDSPDSGETFLWPSCSRLSVIPLAWSVTLQQAEQLA